MGYIQKCEICNQIESVEEATDTEVELSNPQQSAEETGSKKKKFQASVSSQHCHSCGDCELLLEQSFMCLFGYKKQRRNYLDVHTVINIPYTLENCVHLYEFYKPSYIPEYDDLAKYSMPAEVNFFKIILLNFNY